MSQETRPIRPTSYVSGAGATVNLPISYTGQDLTSVDSVCAAPAAGAQLIVMGVMFTNATGAAITMVLQYDTGSSPTDLFPDVTIAANASVVLIFPQCIPVPEAKDLGVKSSSSDTGNAVMIFAYTDYC